MSRPDLPLHSGQRVKGLSVTFAAGQSAFRIYYICTNKSAYNHPLLYRCQRERIVPHIECAVKTQEADARSF